MSSDSSEARTLGFRDAPEHFTPACLGYMGRIIEIREFTSFFFGILKALPNVKDLSEDEKAMAQLAAKKDEILSYDYSIHRQFMNEIMLSRSVESFDLYVLQVLRLVFEVQPNLLKSESAIDAATVLELGTFEQIVFHLAERRLHDLSYKPISELQKYVKTRLDLDLFKSPEEFETFLLASEVRNLIAHNDCEVSQQFGRRTKDIVNPLEVSEHGKVLIDDEWLHRTCYTLDGVVFDFDEAAVLKFGLKTSGEIGFELHR
jgi:hypothetical protein